MAIETCVKTDISKTPCADCTDHCCTILALTISDVARIVRTLRLPFDEFLALYVNEMPDMQSYVFNIQNRPRSLVLKIPQGETAGSDCPFLMKFDTRQRCGIYDFRPGVCRIFPFKRIEGQITPDPRVECVARFSVAQDDPQFQQRFDDYERELAIHAEFCKQWNEPPRYPSNFAKLLEFVQGLIDSGEVN